MQTVPARSEIAIEHTWNAESAFPTIADWQAEFTRIAAQLPELARFQGRLGDGPYGRRGLVVRHSGVRANVG